MTPQIQLRRNLKTITWTIAGIGVAVTLLFAAVFLYARRDQARLIETQLAKHSVMIELQSAIGYGGMIHHFKNWVLRPDEPQYRDAAVDSAQRALQLLDRLEGIMAESQPDTSLEAQRQTIRAYLDHIGRVVALHEAGVSAREIDTAVRISDTDALGELARLRGQVIAHMQSQQSALEDRKALVLLLPFALIALLTAGLLVLVRQRARLRFEHDATRIDEMEQFTQIAVHDLRAPLRQIASLAEFALDDLGETAGQGDARSHVQMIANRAAKLEALVAAVFRYIRVEGAAQEITEVDLRALVEEIARLHVPAGGSVSLVGEFPVVRAQAVELGIILRNLISNAVKHHPDQRPQIIVRHLRAGNGHRFEVEDNGPGIARTDAGKVFDMFWSLEKRENSAEVSGVGLALVRRIVTRWGTGISLRDASPSGTIFSFTMPAF